MRLELEELQKRIQFDPATYRGRLEMRWNQNPLFTPFGYATEIRPTRGPLAYFGTARQHSS